jgi:hypothetical protein
MNAVATINRIKIFSEDDSVGLSPEASANQQEERNNFWHFYEPVSRKNLLLEFYCLMISWKKDVRLLSSMTDKCMHPAYQRIIGMGKEALPFIFSELQRESDYWFWALKSITGVDPVPQEDRGSLKKMSAIWLEWAEENHYL